MRLVLGRTLFVCAVLRAGWWAWTCVVHRWWAQLDVFAARMEQKGWSTALGTVPDAHPELLGRCLLRPGCTEVLLRRTERLTLQVTPPEWLALGLAGALMVGLLLTLERSSALSDDSPGKQLRQAVRRK
ncbi:hypothetical protein [Deinococcus marmoris]|uniref:Uncharacterized protein n=1 Tax=Deinococcus marmoris TaxID=249408 RepID=A0A1U7NXD3_9DEIO|nr:hypothetical protein [Deinococcus marmoris]OLV17564.1 hypothetical protein BOO71_0008212 [Deinococcus marmoris]